MSTGIYATAADAERADADATADDPSRRLWHNAATWDDLIASLLGRPFTAKCGKRCQNEGGIARHRSQLPPIAQCMVCRDLWDAELEDGR